MEGTSCGSLTRVLPVINEAFSPRCSSRQPNESMICNCPRLEHLGSCSQTARQYKESEKYPMRLDELKKLSTKESNEILLNLCLPGGGFSFLLNDDNTNRDTFAHVVLVLGQACKSPLLANLATLVKSVVQNPNFMSTLQKYLRSFQGEQNSKIHLDSLVKLLDFFECFQKCLPIYASKILPLHLPNVEAICKEVLVSDENFLRVIEKKIQEVENSVTKFREAQSAECIREKSESGHAELKQTPESFHAMSVSLTHEDVKESSQCLQPNITRGKYRNSEHYLDVHFRLLREDYIRPLREGINWYVSQKQGKVTPNPGIKVYENVSIEKQEFVDNEFFRVAHLDAKYLAEIGRERGKRLRLGSVVCLSSDEFKTMYCATIVNKDCETLERVLLLRFEEPTSVVLDNELEKFVIIEINAYFEGYRHNLTALQDMLHKKFPMKKYIVDVQETVSSPEYLNPWTVYDFAPLLLESGSFDQEENQFRKRRQRSSSLENLIPEDNVPEEKQKPVNVQFSVDWPTPDEMGMDESQCEALKYAIRKEFVLIQGRPGTGKTFFASKIVQLLSYNFGEWISNVDKQSPILVICPTDHCCEQFVKRVLKFTDDVVVIGPHCSDETLHLKNRRMAMDVPSYISRNIVAIQDVMKDLQDSLEEAENEIAETAHSIISEDVLECYMKSEHFNSLKCYVVMKNSDVDDGFMILDWLDVRYTENIELVEDQGNDNRGCISSTSLHIPSSLMNYGLKEDQADVDDDLEVRAAMGNMNLYPEDFSCNLTANSVTGINAFGCDETGSFVEREKQRNTQSVRIRLSETIAMASNEAESVSSLYSLSITDRWRLYKYWVNQYVESKQTDFCSLQVFILDERKKLSEIKEERDLWILRNSLILVTTTVAAAKHRQLLGNVGTKIVIVDGISDILESLVVTSLPQDIEHLILIGDDYVKPSTNVDELGAKYNLNLSLSRRMMNNGLEYCLLKFQHRMRPCISSLLFPSMYRTLYDHKFVEDYENVKGCTKNNFFVSHNFSEEALHDSRSEAKFIIQLCKYLLLQGYSPSEITILAMNLTQLSFLKELAGEDLCKNVRVTCVDNFRGEENEIILVSFATCNEEESIDSPRAKNRVYAALSRAKKGLFCIGNLQLLAGEIWEGVFVALSKQGAVGHTLRLQCQNHVNVFIDVSEAQDFSNVPDGGCCRSCEYTLPCGHLCTRKCHSYDTDHTDFQCLKDCERKICESGHKCPKRCYEKCPPCDVLLQKSLASCGHNVLVQCHIPTEEFGCREPCLKIFPCGHKCQNLCCEACGPCDVLIGKTIPTCNHKVLVPCCTQTDEFVCDEKCDKILSCGHKCQRSCSELCTLFCCEVVSTIIQCGHEMKVKCFKAQMKDSFTYSCEETCKAVLHCGHLCWGNCSKCCQGRIHVPCAESCQRILACGHQCRAPCSVCCPPCQEVCENRCGHGNCSFKCGLPCRRCDEPCGWCCQHQICTNSCGQLCNREPCNEPCREILKCGHVCQGFCGEPCPPWCITCDREKLRDTVLGFSADVRLVLLEDCGHVFEVGNITRWMDKDDDDSVKRKKCPKCKMAITKSFRFGNRLKSRLADLEAIKKTILGSRTENENMRNVLIKDLSILSRDDEAKFLAPLMRLLQMRKSLSSLEILRFKSISKLTVNFFAFQNMFRHVKKFLGDASSCKVTDLQRLIRFSENTFLVIGDFIRQRHATADEQGSQDVTCEMTRFKLQCEFLNLLKNADDLKDPVPHAFLEVVDCLCQSGPFRKADECKFNSLMEKFRLRSTAHQASI